jgi:hypothetical protein
MYPLLPDQQLLDEDPEENSPLSYERDIAPLKKQFFQQMFSDPRMSEAAKQRASSRYSAVVDRAYGDVRKPISDERAEEQTSRLRDMQYKSAVFSLQQNRDEAARKKQDLSVLAPITLELDSIISNPNLSDGDKQRELARSALRNSSLLSDYPSIGAAYTSARSGIVRDERKDQFTVGSAMAKGFDMEELVKEAEKAGKPFNPSDFNAQVDPYLFNKVAIRQQRAAGEAEYNRSKQDKADVRAEAARERALKRFSDIQFQDPMESVDADPNKFKDPASTQAAKGIIISYGTPEDRDKYAKAKTDAERYVIADEVTTRMLTTTSGGPSKAEETASLYGP